MKKFVCTRANARAALVALAGVVLMAGPSSAAILTFTDLPSWEAAVAGSTLEDFESAIADDDFTFSATISPNGDLGLSAIEESGFTNNMFVDFAPFVSGSDFNGSDAHVSLRFLSHDPIDSVTISLPAGLSAFALDYNNYDNQGDTADLSFSGTNGGALTTFATSTGFYGVVDTGGGATISSFTIAGGDPSIGTGSSTFFSFDNVRYGTAVPEPTSFALLTAMGIAALSRRRRAV